MYMYSSYIEENIHRNFAEFMAVKEVQYIWETEVS